MRNERIRAASIHAIEVDGVVGGSRKRNIKAIVEKNKSTDMMNASGQEEVQKTTTEASASTPKPEQKKDNTMLYIGLGIVAVIGIYYFVSKN